MYNDLAVFKAASALARHAAGRQTVIAQNIANADTPGYKAHDLPDFSANMLRAEGAVEMRATRPGHITTQQGSAAAAAVARESPGDASPNGNTVSIETEMVNGSQAKQQHDLALATYRSSIDLLRTALGRGR